MVSTKKHYILLILTLCGLVLFLVYSKYLREEVVIKKVPTMKVLGTLEYIPRAQVIPEGKYEYFQVTESCDFYQRDICIPVYAGPGVQYEKIYELRRGMVLKIKNKVNVDGQIWYHVYFDEWLRHGERVGGDWYVPAVSGRVVYDDGNQNLTGADATTTKRIVVDLSEQMIYAYDGDKSFLMAKVSTGTGRTPTPEGTFTIYKKTPSRYMQGPIEGVTDTPFDLPGVPWNMYFTQGGAVIHGTYWHDKYGTQQSNGCINLPSDLAKVLYDWAPVGTTVTVQE